MRNFVIGLMLVSLASALTPVWAGNVDVTENDAGNQTIQTGGIINNDAQGGAGGSATATGGSATVGAITNTNTANGGLGGTATVGNVTNSASGGSGGSSSQTQSADNSGVTVGGQSVKMKVYSYGHSAAPAAAGTDAISVGTFLGGVGFSRTSAFSKTDQYLTRVVEACNTHVLSEDECLVEQRSTLKRLKKQSKKNDRTLFGDLFGILW